MPVTPFETLVVAGAVQSLKTVRMAHKTVHTLPAVMVVMEKTLPASAQNMVVAVVVVREQAGTTTTLKKEVAETEVATAVKDTHLIHPLTMRQLLARQIAVVAVVGLHTLAVMRQALEGLGSLSFATRVRQQGLEAQSQSLVGTRLIHLLLRGHTQDESFCKGGRRRC